MILMDLFTAIMVGFAIVILGLMAYAILIVIIGTFKDAWRTITSD